MTRAALLAFLDQTARLLARAAGATLARVALAGLIWVVMMPFIIPDAGLPPWSALAIVLGLYSVAEQVVELLWKKRP